MLRLSRFGAGLVIAAAPVLVSAMSASAAMSAESVNIYSARHYDTDDLLYDGFQNSTGIEVNVIEAEGPALIARIKAEGANSPADIFLTVDAGNLWAAESEGLFQPIESPILAARIPASLRDPENLWYGFSTRARLIFVNPAKVDPALVQSYESLADPRLKGQICMRTSAQVYNLSLMGAMIERLGAAEAEKWAKGVVANFARRPQGADTSLLLSVAAGECGVTIANHYYYLRLLRSNIAMEAAAAKKLQPIFPNQNGAGTHINISGAGVLLHAPHREAAIRFLEYLASDDAQRIFIGSSDEFPAVKSAGLTDSLKALGEFKADPINVSVYGTNQAQAQMIFDRAGWN
nr:MAG: extracellular solute-binding protein [Hyphomicrobiales bacterium]